MAFSICRYSCQQPYYPQHHHQHHYLQSHHHQPPTLGCWTSPSSSTKDSSFKESKDDDDDGDGEGNDGTISSTTERTDSHLDKRFACFSTNVCTDEPACSFVQ